MSNTKEEVLDIVRNLPDDADYEDIIEALCLRLTIEDRLRELDAGEYLEHDQVEEILHKSSPNHRNKDVSHHVISAYIDCAMKHAVYQKLEDNTYGGRIPPCLGVVAFGETLRKCKNELRSTLEDWILIGIRFGDELPVIDGLDLNVKVERESLETV
ncbi:MAG: hypothetical protein V2A61_04500 [Calditrichota bacterium]